MPAVAGVAGRARHGPGADRGRHGRADLGFWIDAMKRQDRLRGAALDPAGLIAD
jgi:hypothetical protein